MGVAATCESCPVSGSGSQLSTGGGATLEGESDGWELLMVGHLSRDGYRYTKT